MVGGGEDMKYCLSMFALFLDTGALVHDAGTVFTYNKLAASPHRRGVTVASRLWLCIFNQIG